MQGGNRNAGEEWNRHRGQRGKRRKKRRNKKK